MPTLSHQHLAPQRIIDRMKTHLLLSLLATVLTATSVHAAPVDLGVAKHFNAFIFNDFSTGSTDAWGSIAVGGNATISGSWGVATHGASYTSGGSEWAMVVGGDLTWRQSGQAYDGLTYVGGSSSVAAPSVNLNPSGNGGLASGASPIDFTAARNDLIELSVTLSDLDHTGTLTSQWGGASFVGSGSDVEVFNVDASALNGMSWLSASSFNNLNKGATVIINVFGDSVTLNYWDGIQFKDYDVLFNFVNASSVTLYGSYYVDILAPYATISGGNGHIEGTVIANKWAAGTELHYTAPPTDSWSPPKTSTPPTSPEPPDEHRVPEPGSLVLTLTLLALLAATRAAARRSASRRGSTCLHLCRRAAL